MFFFSSRRRHTRYWRDWSSDVCSSDLEEVRVPFALQGLIGTLAGPEDPGTAFVGFYHELGEAAGAPGAWGYARGGVGAVTAALRLAVDNRKSPRLNSNHAHILYAGFCFK